MPFVEAWPRLVVSVVNTLLTQWVCAHTRAIGRWLGRDVFKNDGLWFEQAPKCNEFLLSGDLDAMLVLLHTHDTLMLSTHLDGNKTSAATGTRLEPPSLLLRMRQTML